MLAIVFVAMGVLADAILFTHSGPMGAGEIFMWLIIAMGSVLWIFLSCLFTPSPKKIAGMLTLILMIAIIIWGTLDDVNRGTFTIKKDTVEDLVILAATLAAYYSNYIIFKNKGWHRIDGSKPQKDLAEIYEEQINLNTQK